MRKDISKSSEAIRGHQRPKGPSEAIKCHRRPSVAIGGHRRPSEAIVRLRGAAPTKNESTPAAAQANGVGCDHIVPAVAARFGRQRVIAASE